MEIPLWSIRYRPQEWKDFVDQDKAVSTLKELAKSGTCPNLILVGPHGTGKSSAAVLFAKEYLRDTFESDFMYLNVRDLVSYPVSKAKRTMRDLAKLTRDERAPVDEYMSLVYQEASHDLKLKGAGGEPNRSQLLHAAIYLFSSTISVAGEKPKVLVLDEADAFDNNMQQALRRTMELYSDACRFIMATTSLAGWSPAILSRCIVLKFGAIDADAISSALKGIAQRELVSVDEAAISAISRVANGDLRRAIDLLQVAAAGAKRVDEDDVYETCETPLTRGTREVVGLAIRGAFDESRKRMKQMLAYDGFPATEVLREIQRDLLRRPFSPSSLKRLLNRTAEIDHRITQARNPFIQLEALLATIQNVAMNERTSA